MSNTLATFKVLTGLANALENKNVKAITPNALRHLAKITLKNYENVDRQTTN